METGREGVPALLDRSVPIVIPAVHPDDNLVTLVDELLGRGVSRVVVVDDGSGKGHAPFFDRCSELGAEVLVHDENMGKGMALKDAFALLIHGEEPIRGCVTADADGQHVSDDVLAVADEFVRLGCESLVLGVRDMGVEGVPRKNRLGNRFINACLRVFCGLSLADSQTGLRGIPLQLMDRCLDLEGDRFEFETQMLLLCHRDTPVVEVPIATIYDDPDRYQTHFDPIRDSLRILYVAVRTFVGFSATSIVTTALDLVLFWVLSRELRLAGIVLWAALATVLARVVSATVNFAINRRRVFRSEGNRRSQALRFVAVAVVQMFLSATLVQALAPLFPHSAAVLVKLAVDLFLFLINYQVQMRLVFAKRE